MAKSFKAFRALALVSSSLLMMSVSAFAQPVEVGTELGALAPENLHKQRPPAPVDLTGTYTFWFGAEHDPLHASPYETYKFLPVPKLTAKAQEQTNKLEEYLDKGLDYRDDPGACWPLGMPRIMTRYWPITVIQLPTAIFLISTFDMNVREIFMDGRKHPSDDDINYSYNGHSIGHWEDKTLVVDTVGTTDDHHWIQEGVPTGNKLHIIERMTRTDKGLTIETTMTDPENWEGEWKPTPKYYTEGDHTDFEEHICIYEQMAKLPTFKKNVRE